MTLDEVTLEMLMDGLDRLVQRAETLSAEYGEIVQEALNLAAEQPMAEEDAVSCTARSSPFCTARQKSPRTPDEVADDIEARCQHS